MHSTSAGVAAQQTVRVAGRRIEVAPSVKIAKLPITRRAHGRCAIDWAREWRLGRRRWRRAGRRRGRGRRVATMRADNAIVIAKALYPRACAEAHRREQSRAKARVVEQSHTARALAANVEAEHGALDGNRDISERCGRITGAVVRGQQLGDAHLHRRTERFHRPRGLVTLQLPAGDAGDAQIPGEHLLISRAWEQWRQRRRWRCDRRRRHERLRRAR